MDYDLEGKIFISISNTDNGEVGEDTLFHYHQDGNVVWAEYEGGEVLQGHLIAKVVDGGKLDMKYHHINKSGDMRLGSCISTPIQLDDGRLKFQEKWQWLCGDESSGYSEIVEVDSVKN